MHQPQVENQFPDLVVEPVAVPPPIMGDNQRMIPAQVDRITGQVWVPLDHQAVKLNNIYTPPARSVQVQSSVGSRSPSRLSQAASSEAAETVIMIEDKDDTKANIQRLPQPNPNAPKIVGEIIYIDVDPILIDEPLEPLRIKEGVQCSQCLALCNASAPFFTSEKARDEHVRAHVDQCGQGFAAVLALCFPDRSAPAEKKKERASEYKKKKKCTSQGTQPISREQQKSAGQEEANDRIEQEWTRVLGTLKSAKSISCRKPGCEASFKEAGQLTRFHLTGHVHYHLDTASTARVTRSSAKHSVEDEKLLLEIQTCFPAV